MRILALAFLFCLIHSVANAETFPLRKVLICDQTEVILKKLSAEFGEVPVWTGESDQENARFALTVNLQTDSWTLLQYDKDIACVLGVGNKSKLVKSVEINL